MSECITATCPHGRRVFILLADGPDEKGRYPWAHGDLWPCDLMEPATAAEAGETCARCGHGSHEHEEPPKEPLPAGTLGRDRGPCKCGECPGMVYRTTALDRELAEHVGAQLLEHLGLESAA